MDCIAMRCRRGIVRSVRGISAARQRRLARVLPVVGLALLATSPAARAATLFVDGAQAACSDSRPATQTTALAPWCSLAPAAGQAQPGDTVQVSPGVYRGTFRPLASGTAASPIRVTATAPGVVLDAAGAANAIKLIAIGGWSFEGMTITGAINQGVWMDSTHDIALRAVTVTANPGVGVQLKAAAGTIVTGSTISANGSAGVLESVGSSGTQITANQIIRNGRGGATFNGDGIQFAGTGDVVTGNTITGNGDPGIYEHGVYAAAASSAWTIAGNVISGSGGANIKASGTGTIRGNRLTDGTYGIVLAANPSPVDVIENVITGSAQHLVFTTTGARGRLLQDTVHQIGRSTLTGDASAIFLSEATSIEIRNTLACYDNPDDLGVALWINNATKVLGVTGDTNWLCSDDARLRHVAYNGSRVDAAAWRSATGADARSVFSGPPTFDADGRPLAPLLGAGIGDPLAEVITDFAGVPWPVAGARDAGAYRLDPGPSPDPPPPSPICPAT